MQQGESGYLLGSDTKLAVWTPNISWKKLENRRKQNLRFETMELSHINENENRNNNQVNEHTILL